MTRDSAVWTITFVSALAVFFSSQFDLLTAAFPSLPPVWESRIELVSAVLGFISGYLKMSPLALRPDHPYAGTSDPHTTLNIFKPGGVA